MSEAHYRNLPAVHRLVDHPELKDSVERHGREALVVAARALLTQTRADIKRGAATPSLPALVQALTTSLAVRPRPFARVINATGVLLHTNLGRAPLCDAAWEAMAEARGYCDLEYDLTSGARAPRDRAVDALLVATTGAAAGMVVNNNAAAVLLGLAGLAGPKPTVISRGHLVEIGGGFRLPTIMAASGSPLREVGTTNRTHLTDYDEALSGAGLVLLVHHSNFVMKGYVAEPAYADVVACARTRGVPVMLDLGSGALLDTRPATPEPELTVPEAVRQGFDVICFSGDKLLGGPQAGYLVGRAPTIAALRAHPLHRALRCDKLQLAAILATLSLYQRGEATQQLPLLAALAQPLSALRARATAWQDAVGFGTVIDTDDAMGGGTLPEQPLAGVALAITTSHPEALVRTLRLQTPAVVAHIANDRVLLHPRTVAPTEDAAVAAALKVAITS